MNFVSLAKKQSKSKSVTIVLPEANLDKRVYEACKTILKNKICKIIVLGSKNDFDDDFNSKNCEIIDIKAYPKLNNLAKKLYMLRKEKGMTEDEAKTLILEPVYFSCMLVKEKIADGIVSGAKYSTADAMRPALQIIKTKKGKSSVTGSMIMVADKKPVLLFGDVSLIQNPDATALGEIAISNAEFMQTVIGAEPKVAMLSFSTKGSAKGEMVEKIVEATRIAKSKTKFLIDGEMQVDSALSKSVATKKGVDLTVGGKANVLIFPDLNAGNIGYKLVSYLGGYKAVGPIMLNFNKPVNDLSRGCTVDDIVNTVCITVLQVE